MELGTPGTNPHYSAYAVNTGRNALHCILHKLRPQKILIPAFLCKAILDPLRKLDIPYSFYSISNSFIPDIPGQLPSDTYLLYINYFGVCDEVVSKLFHKYPRQLIVDNTQAFFSQPIDGVPTFYSTRKFFGVPDGGYFYGIDFNVTVLPTDQSWNRCRHLLIRRDISPERGYTAFKENEKCLSDTNVARMSRLTKSLLSAINYNHAENRRRHNFEYLHSYLKESNQLSEYIGNSLPAISYPYLTDCASTIRKALLKHRVYIPILWDNSMISDIPYEINAFARNIVHIPIDHRYNETDMRHMLEIVDQVADK